MKFSYQKPHDYLFLNVDAQKIYNQDFDEIILDDEN